MKSIEITEIKLDSSELTANELASAQNINTDKNPDIIVNGIQIPEEDILQEMQYHPADDQREAMINAAEALIIVEVLKQRCDQLGIKSENGAALSEDEMLAELMAQEVQVPTITFEECERYFEANREKFHHLPYFRS